MTVELAAVQIVRKPWGRVDLNPWSSIDASADPVGEVWLERQDKRAPTPALLFKLLFTSRPLSIQVHPNDELAASIGLPNGKTEAWYVLSATPGARVALGLKESLTPEALRAAIGDGSIAGLAQWCAVVQGDVIFVPGGTIHAIGANIVLAEIQQRSDTTYRLFDFDRNRELHEDAAVAASDTGIVTIQPVPQRLTEARTVLVTSRHFVLERADLDPESNWTLETDRETWILVIEGSGHIGSVKTAVGDAIFMEADRAGAKAGSHGLSLLIAYPGPDPVASLLRDCTARVNGVAGGPAVDLSATSDEIIEVLT